MGHFIYMLAASEFTIDEQMLTPKLFADNLLGFDCHSVFYNGRLYLLNRDGLLHDYGPFDE